VKLDKSDASVTNCGVNTFDGVVISSQYFRKKRYLDGHPGIPCCASTNVPKIANLIIDLSSSVQSEHGTVGGSRGGSGSISNPELRSTVSALAKAVPRGIYIF
jgi:hypothetical protein